MNEYVPSSGSAEMQVERAAIEQAALKALARRRTSGQILTYELDGWVVQEYPGGRIERLATVDQFKAADFPYPGFVAPSR